MPFESLRETLLKGGIAPRHVRRYLAELSEHLDDLTAGQRELGYDGENAQLRARALLGEDRELAAAMLEQESLRSLAARAPWFIFGLLPPMIGIVGAFVLIVPLVLTAQGLGMMTPGSINAPLWFQQLAQIVTWLGRAWPPVLATGFVLLAVRQRIVVIWPLLAVALLALMDMQFRAEFPPPGQHGGSLSIGAALWLAHAESLLDAWPFALTQLLLTLAPAFWLFRKRMIAS